LQLAKGPHTQAIAIHTKGQFLGNTEDDSIGRLMRTFGEQHIWLESKRGCAWTITADREHWS
jgi:hypothetical protein